MDELVPGSQEGRRGAPIVLSFVLVGAAVVVLAYFSYAIYRTHAVVQASLPCEPEVITSTSPIIAPPGYSLHSEEDVAASKAWEACMAESRELFASEGITTLSSSLYWPLIGFADVVAASLVVAGWTVGVVARVRRQWLYGLGGLTLLGVVALSFQIRFSETIDLVSWIVD